MSRVVVWFSCGAASAVAGKLVLSEHGHNDVVVAYTDTGAEHPDNARFIQHIQTWYGHEIQILKTDKYTDTWDVWLRTRYLVGPTGARCTGELKKKVRFAFQQPDDIHVFGFTADRREVQRAERFREQNPEIDLRTPLIERGINKKDCIGILDAVGIAIPAMYRMGYQNNNCIGCVKGGMGYWNKIRRDFPDVFDRMARLEQEIGATVLRSDGRRLPLTDLDPHAGRYVDEPHIECGPLCTATAADFTSDAA